MKREVELERRLRSLSALGEAIGAMKSLSAHHFRQARDAVAPARSYREGIERLIDGQLAQLPAGDGPAGLLVVGGELGLCGAYNAHVVAAASAAREALGPGPTMCVGRRAAALLARRQIEIQKRYAGPTSVRGVTPLLLRLAEQVIDTYVDRRCRSFHVTACPFEGVGSVHPATTRLLPITPRASGRETPVRYVSRADFAAAALRELLYIALYDQLIDALASEHGARLVATQSAEQWLDEHTNGLRRRLASARREAGTLEMIEIAAGANARQRRARGRHGRGVDPPAASARPYARSASSTSE